VVIEAGVDREGGGRGDLLGGRAARGRDEADDARARLGVVAGGRCGSGCSDSQFAQFNGAAIRPPTFGSVGMESGRNYMRGCLTRNVDMSVVRRIRVTHSERYRAELRADVFNALNNQKLIAWNTTIKADPASAKDSLGLATGYLPGPTFGTATANNQFPAPLAGVTGGRTLRLAVGVRF